MNTEETRRRRIGLAMGALGVVYGDIGTSPLYALRECFHGAHALDPVRGTVLGVLSAVIWSLILIVGVKYLWVVMQVNNRGEGGTMALLALILSRLPHGVRRTPLLVLGALGASLLMGDGMITPPISVLGAVEGLRVAAPGLGPFVVPITVMILVGLFAVQRVGTGGVGRLFGPLTLVWFLTIGVLGIRGLWMEPGVLAAVNPWHAVTFFAQEGWGAFAVLGAVFLVLTGSEALYADMGHFGAGPIRLAWVTVAFPALLLNYLGQGAWLLRYPEAAMNPFYSLAPSWGLYPLVALATVAAIIASQALISGAFSTAYQAMQLGFLPRLKVHHTSSQQRGQIYIGAVNWLLLMACVGLVLGFRSSTGLASAYGIGVSLSLMVTSVMLWFAARHVWGWTKMSATMLAGFFVGLELMFLASNAIKLESGGWFPVVMAALIYLVLATWFRGRGALRKQLLGGSLPLGMFLSEMERKTPVRVSGTAVFMTGNPEGTPGALLHNLKHNKVLHETVILLRFAVAEAPFVEGGERIQIEKLTLGFHRVTAFFGFMETPDLEVVQAACERAGLEVDPMKTTFFLGRETILPTRRPGMASWRKHLFAFMSRNAQQATSFFKLPPNRVVELGMQVEL